MANEGLDQTGVVISSELGVSVLRPRASEMRGTEGHLLILWLPPPELSDYYRVIGGALYHPDSFNYPISSLIHWPGDAVWRTDTP